MAKDMSGQCGPKCIILGLISAALAAGGLWAIVGGVMKQWGGMPWTAAFLWYFGGLVLWCIAKCVKMKACPVCKAV